jgi:hypothetical protein
MSTRLLFAGLFAFPLVSLADHPLLSEDTGVLGKGGWQMELHGERPRDGGSTALAAVLGYGIAEKADLQLELPYVRHEGTGDPSLALKWRFFEAGPASMVFKPFVAEDAWGADLAGAYEVGRLEVIGHLGYARERVDGERASLRHASFAFLYGLTNHLRLVADFARDSTDEALYSRVLGAAYELTEDIDLGFGVQSGDVRAWLFGAKLRW